MKSQDEIDTEPLLPRGSEKVVYQVSPMEPGDRVEIELRPQSPLANPLLVLSCRPWVEIMVEQIARGGVVITDRPQPILDYKFGGAIDELVTRDEPLRILLVNNSTQSVMIGASLVAVGGSLGAYRSIKERG